MSNNRIRNMRKQRKKKERQDTRNRSKWNWLKNQWISIPIIILAAFTLYFQLIEHRYSKRDRNEKVKPYIILNRLDIFTKEPENSDSGIIMTEGKIKLSNMGEYSCTIENAVVQYIPYKRVGDELIYNRSCSKEKKIRGLYLRKKSSSTWVFGPHSISCDFKGYDRVHIILRYDLKDINGNIENGGHQVRLMKTRKRWRTLMFDPSQDQF